MNFDLGKDNARQNPINLERASLPVSVDLDRELAAIQHGDLRSSNQIREIFRALAHGNPHQLAVAGELELGLLVEGITLRQTPTFGIRISEDLSTLEYFKVLENLSFQDLNPTSKTGRLFASDLYIAPLLKIDNPTLISPNSSYLKDVDLELQDCINDLARSGRLTFFGDIPTTWNPKPDNDAWAPNIDTVHFIKWLRDINAFEGNLKKTAEIGVGTGLISQALLSDNSRIERHLFTDISPYAINASRRNILPFAGTCDVDYYFGKGIKGLVHEGPFDLIITNPPYIPHQHGESDVDPYRGTGLIKELFQVGPSLLNKNNPDAAIFFQCSNLTLADIARYQAEFSDVELTQVAGPKRVPLRIQPMHTELEWLDFMKGIGLIESPELAKSTGLRYYHDIYAFKLTAK